MRIIDEGGFQFPEEGWGILKLISSDFKQQFRSLLTKACILHQKQWQGTFVATPGTMSKSLQDHPGFTIRHQMLYITGFNPLVSAYFLSNLGIRITGEVRQGLVVMHTMVADTG